MNYKQQVEEAVSHLAKRVSSFPDTIIQLGTGMGGALSEAIKNPQIIPYSQIPHFQESTVTSHVGNLVTGTLAGKRIAVLQGRMHLYEGYSARQVTLPIRALSLLGGKKLIVTNAAGGLNPDWPPGTIMSLSDHINMLGANPLCGPNVNSWGPRFPDMSEAYSPRLVNIAKMAAARCGVTLRSGIYVAIPGPSLETPAETRLLRQLGADAVGMSTIPEVIVAKHAGLEILGLSVISNTNNPDNFKPILLQDVLDKMQETEPLLTKMIVDIIQTI